MLAGLADELEVVLRQLHRRLDRIAAAGGEEDPVEVARRIAGQTLRDLDRLRVDIRPQRHERQLHRLVVHRLGDGLTTVAHLDGEKAGETVEVLLALVIEDVVAFAAYDDRRLTTVEQCLVW